MPMDWTPPPRGTGGPNPDLNQVLEEVKKKLPSFKPSRGIVLVVAVIVILLLGANSYYTVGPEETGVVLRFGQYSRETGPGLHFKLPGIEKAIMVPTARVFKEEFGFRGIGAGVRSKFAEEGYQDESLMLTGDLDVIDVKWIAQYQIREPRKWLFQVADGRAAIRDLSEAVMRNIVGNSKGEDVLTTERTQVAAQAEVELQKLLNEYQTGVKVITVKLQDVNPPGPVQPAFNEVNEATQQRIKLINEADEIYLKQIARARGDAARITQEAEGYATEQVNRAQGEVTRFKKVLAAYRQAEEVTKRRFYLDAMQKLIKNARRVYVVDEDVKSIMPFMNLTGGEGMGKAVQQ
jgi:membrane protease subunit HflK